jgi:hypothetical protein
VFSFTCESPHKLILTVVTLVCRPGFGFSWGVMCRARDARGGTALLGGGRGRARPSSAVVAFCVIACVFVAGPTKGRLTASYISSAF